MSSKNKVIDIRAVKTFFDPIQREKIYGKGMMPPMPAVPTMVKEVAEELNGKTMALTEAVTKIHIATQWRGEVVVLEDCIMLYSQPRANISKLLSPLHVWRVIRYK